MMGNNEKWWDIMKNYEKLWKKWWKMKRNVGLLLNKPADDEKNANWWEIWWKNPQMMPFWSK